LAKDGTEVSEGKKTKTFAIPSTLARWFDETVYEEPTGVVKKDWLYNQYVKLCREKSIRPKHKQIFSKLVFTVFPRAGSCRLGSIGSQVPYYFGIKRRKEKSQKKDKLRTKESVDQAYQPQTRSALGREDATRLRSVRLPIPIAPKVQGGVGGKRKHEETLDSIQQNAQMNLKKIKSEEETEGEQEENTAVLSDLLKQRLMNLHILLAPKDADPYQGDIELYLNLFVDRFWPELSPLQWDLSEVSTNVSEQEMNSYALCLCCSLFCGALVQGDIAFAKDMLLLCSSLVNSLAIQTKMEGTTERLHKNFGISLLFLARGLVDCSLFQNDIDAVVMAKNYCAMAAEIFP